MVSKRQALRFGAWFTLVYVAIGGVIVTVFWLPVVLHGHAYHRQWASLPWYVSGPLMFNRNQLWLPSGVLLNVLAVIAFFRAAGGRQGSRLFWVYGCGIALLALLQLGLVICLILLSPIRVVTSAVTSATWYFGWGDLFEPSIVAVLLCLPLFVLLIISALWTRNMPEGSNRCAICGYNLTGNTSGVCPECGEAI